MLAGYDDSGETYTVRHKWRTREGSDFSVRYDAIGHTDPAELFNVMVYDGPSEIDERTTHRTALRNAVASANERGMTRRRPCTMSTPAGSPRTSSGARPSSPRTSLPSIPTSTPASSGPAGKAPRGISGSSPPCSRKRVMSLNAAAARYERELDALEPLYEICHTAKHEEDFPEDARARARALIAEALEADRKAVAHIEAALAILD